MSTGPKPVLRQPTSTGKPVLRPGASTRGGYRPNSGPKPIYSLSEAERKRMIRAMRAAEKAHGKTMGELVAEWVFSEDWKKSSAAVQLYLRDVLAKTNYQDVTVTKGPAEPHIYLPESRPDPAKVVSLGDRA